MENYFNVKRSLPTEPKPLPGRKLYGEKQSYKTKKMTIDITLKPLKIEFEGKTTTIGTSHSLLFKLSNTINVKLSNNIYECLKVQ